MSDNFANTEATPDYRPISNGVEPDSDSLDTNTSVKVAMLKQRRVSRFSTLESLLVRFSPAERLLLYILAICLGLSTLVLLSAANTTVSVEVPAPGGSLTEGEVGPARFINPVLTLSQADEDLSALIYSGLTRSLPGSTIIPDLADSYSVSEDGSTYTFTLKKDLIFHDGTPLTSADVLYTIQQVQNPSIKSPHRADWEGVSVTAPDATTVVFKLPHAYAPFIQNTSIGILPSNLWKNISNDEFPFSSLNTHPIGSGAFKIKKVNTDNSGSATEYDLVPFSAFALGQPYLKHITFRFYANEEAMIKALNAHKIDAVAGVSPTTLSDISRTDVVTMTTGLPRTFGVFFNQAHSKFLTDSSVRSALDASIDKQLLINSVLQGYGTPLSAPFHLSLIGKPTALMLPAAATTTPAYTDDTIIAAHSILLKGGWKYNEADNTWNNKKGEILGFTLSTADSPQLVATANAVADAWKKLGINVTVQIYSLSDLNTNVIRPREYDALLFGEVIGRELDLFAFWHSSQRNDPGLNLSLYTNAKADTLLSQARATTNASDRYKLYAQFASLVEKDTPAVFLYAPEFIYEVPRGIRGIKLGALTVPAERFLNAYQWYTDTERVWTFFTNKSIN